MITCPYCGATEKQRNKGFNTTGKPTYSCFYCNRRYSLGSKLRARPGSNPVVIRQCLRCGSETTNPKFCSTSCAAKHNNVIAPKRTKQQRFCKHCGIQISERRTVCDSCIPNQVDWSHRTLGEVQIAAKYQINAVGRDLARQSYKRSGCPRICQNCGYSKHVEICHIKAVKDFPIDTPMSIVSGIDNLVALCPNCHWEFDHGHLLYEDIAPR